jgi:hypothetical protein
MSQSSNIINIIINIIMVNNHSCSIDFVDGFQTSPQPFGKSPPAPHTALATSLATSGVPSENQSPWEPPAIGKMETWNCSIFFWGTSKNWDEPLPGASSKVACNMQPSWKHHST